MPYRNYGPRTAISRFTAILSTFLTGEIYSVTEIARLTGLPVSTTHRLANDMAAWQLLRRMPDGRFEIGPTVRQLGGHPRPEQLAERAPQVVSELSEATHRRARLGVMADGVLAQGRVAYVEKRARSEPATGLTDAATLPAHATALGKALLAFASPSVVATASQHLRVFTPNTIDTPEGLRRTLGVVRLTRWATASGELTPGECAVAVPVFGQGGSVVAALELEVQNMQSDVELARTVLAVAARGLSRELAIDPGRSGHLRLVPVSPPAGGDRRKVVP